MRRIIAPVLLLLSACSEPGRAVTPEPGDFAFIEVTLKG
jgi:hypothetical protein